MKTYRIFIDPIKGQFIHNLEKPDETMIQNHNFRQLEGDCDIYKRPQKKQPRADDELQDENRFKLFLFFIS